MKLEEGEIDEKKIVKGQKITQQLCCKGQETMYLKFLEKRYRNFNLD